MDTGTGSIAHSTFVIRKSALENPLPTSSLVGCIDASSRALLWLASKETLHRDTMDTHYEKWQTLAPLGLVAVGLGASLAGQAAIWKARRCPTWTWVTLGTLGLASLNAGLCLFGEAVKHRTLYEWGVREG